MDETELGRVKETFWEEQKQNFIAMTKEKCQDTLRIEITMTMSDVLGLFSQT